jgi:transcriptional regulator with XRE-family HTH domain
MRRGESNLLPALIKHWRGRRGLSQLDLALAAGVSSRHVSFVETGRARPSPEMILRLAGAMSVPLRDQNAMLAAAGYEEVFEEPGLGGDLPGPIRAALEQMLAQHEPFPMIVVDRRYDVLTTNRGAAALLPRLVADPAAITAPLNTFRLLFDPRLARPRLLDWERLAGVLLARLHREALERGNDSELEALRRSLFAYPDIPRSWQQPDLSAPSEPCLTVRVRMDDVELAFLTTMTVFSAPQNVTLDELRIESFFPLDETTRRACRSLARP